MKIITPLFVITLVLQVLFTATAAEKINRIEHSGLKNTERDTVECRLRNKEGCEYSEEKWLEERDSLLDLDIFADVQLDVDKCAEGVNLTYCYKELPSYIIYPAMKQTDQDGILIGPGITFMNIGGLGIHQELMSRFTVLPDFMKAKEALSYTSIPKITGLPLTVDLTVNYFESYNSLKLYKENSYYAQFNLNYSFSKTFKAVGSTSAFYVKHDKSEPVFTKGSEDIRMFYGSGNWDYLPSAGAGIIIDTRERQMNPHSGIYNEYRATIYGSRLGGDADFTEYLCDFRGYLPVGDNHIIHANFLGRFRPGSVPGYELYHVGGANSLRAYNPDPSMCGQHEALATIEYRYELFTHRQISLWDIHGYYGLQFVGGMDNAVEWMKGDRYNKGTYYNSFYAGIHLLVPVLERVRFECGYSGLENDRYNVSFAANLSWYEKAYTQRRRVR